MKATAKKIGRRAAETPVKAKSKKLKVVPKNHRAVMASRREAPDSLEFFPTPPWATRALCKYVLELEPGVELILSGAELSVWEPAAGEGHMAEPLREYFAKVYASDVFDYGRGYDVGAFVVQNAGLVDDLARCPFDPDWIISNPPFKLVDLFVLEALKRARVGVAMFLPATVLGGCIERYEQFLAELPPTIVAHFVERVPLQKGFWNPNGSTATNYVWLVWVKRRGGRTDTIWIPPGQRIALTKPDDVRRFGPDAGADLFEAKGE
jgi:hypothetical protein